LCLVLAACSFDHGLVPGDAMRDGNGSDVATDTGTGSDTMMPTLRAKTITIGANVTGTHTDFPLWVALTDADIAARARSDGTDIHFVAGTTPLAYEIQHWSKNDGRLEAWVRLPSLAAGTTLAVRYGDIAAAHAANPAQTFAAYNAVWHFDDPLNNATIADAHGTTNGTGVNLGPSDSVTAQLGRGIDFNDDNEQITFTNPLTANTPHTISAWVNQATSLSNDALIALGPGGTMNQARWLHTRFNGPEIAVGFYANDWTAVNYDITGDGWVMIAWVYEGSNRMSRMYINGALVAGPFQHGSNVNTTGTEGMIGNAPIAYGTDMGINATLDEVRIINVVHSPAWIAAEYANQMAPGTFYSVSAEQVP
jgi:hypothetical protein